MHVGALRVEVRIPGVRSLKEKRRVVKSVIAQISNAHPVAIAEVDHQDLWQRASFGIAAVAPQSGHLDRMLHTIERELRVRQDIEVLDSARTYLEDPM
jgi:uncharacterized protein YlxP (DUF503 family)